MKNAYVILIVLMTTATLFAQTESNRKEAAPGLPQGELVKPASPTVGIEKSVEPSMSSEEVTAWGLIFEALENKQSNASVAKSSGSGGHSGRADCESVSDKGESGLGRSGHSGGHEVDHDKGEKGSGGDGGHGSDSRPAGWDKGEKKGWDGGDVPPGQRKQNKKRGGK